jgi:hypothetical protein
MTRIIDFLNQLFGEGTAVSSKRVSGIVTLINLLVLAYISTYKNGTTPQFMYETLALLCGSFLGLTSIERIFVKKPEDKEK